jgi:hypothetical protein
MRKLIAMAAFMVASVAMMEGTAQAWHVMGTVYCDANLNGVIDEGDLPVSGLTVTVTGTSGTSFTGSDTTGNYGAGAWAVFVLDTPGSYKITLTGNASPVISPASLTFSLTDAVNTATVNILLDGQACTELKCWLTGGGVKFSSITHTELAEKGPVHNFGGNVNPSCDSDPGDGGNWNHIAQKANLHFQGTSIQVVRCGNVADHPPGSTSPVTPYNFIEFQGTGTLKGIGGNKADYGQVTFFARAEDRNEPGGEAGGKNAGAYIDRYYLQVTNTAGTKVLLNVDTDSVTSTVDPLTITGGNMQIHISSCATK